MHRILSVCLLGVLLVAPQGWASDQETPPAEPTQAAMAFAGSFSNDQLSGMLSRIGGRSETMRGLSKLGGSFVADVFDFQIDEAVKKYGPAWQRNMALAWQPLLTDAEMISLMTEGATSPHSQKYTDLRSQAGEAMQATSQDLFRDILSEVLRETQATLTEQQK